MDEGSIEKTAFCPGLGYGLWEFTVMPYGLTGATQTCQRALNHILKSCKDCVDNYIDDIIVFSDTIEFHIRDLRRMLSKLKAAGFTLRDSKCFFGDIKAPHLGFEYSSMGVVPYSEKTKAIQDWPTSISSKDVRSFLGLVNFFRKGSYSILILPTISQGFLVTIGCKGAGGLVGALTFWQMTQ